MTKEEILSLIDAAAEKHVIPPALLRAQVQQESSFSPDAISECGAMGLLQLELATARELGLNCLDCKVGWTLRAYLSFARDAKDDRLDPYLNLDAGARYLRLEYYHFPEIVDPEERWKFALASYNAGRGHINNAVQLAKSLNAEWQQWNSAKIYLQGCDVQQVRDYVSKIWANYKSGDPVADRA